MDKDFEGKDIKIIIENRIKKEVPYPINGTNELNQFLSKALQRDPKKRFQSAAEMKEELESLEKNNLLPKVVVALPIMMALAIKMNPIQVFGTEATKQMIKEGTKKTLKQTLTSMTTSAKVIIGITVSIVVGGSVFMGLNGSEISSMFGKSSKAEELYKDLDTKDIYEKLNNKMNNEIKYAKVDINSKHPAYYRNEVYIIDGKTCTVQRFKDDTEEDGYYDYSIHTPKKWHMLMNMEDGKSEYSVHDIESQTKDSNYDKWFYNFYDIESFEVKNIIKKEVEGKLSLILQRKNNSTENIHSTIEYIINDDGYVETIVMRETDESFEKVTGREFTETYSNYNKKSEADFYKEIEKMKSFDGMAIDQIIEKSGFKK